MRTTRTQTESDAAASPAHDARDLASLRAMQRAALSIAESVALLSPLAGRYLADALTNSSDRACASVAHARALTERRKRTPHARAPPPAPAAVAALPAARWRSRSPLQRLRPYPELHLSRTHTEFNRDVGYLFKILIWLGTASSSSSRRILLYTHRALPAAERAATRRSTCTATRRSRSRGRRSRRSFSRSSPFPTVRTIFKTQAKAKADALQVEVIGHQWWWEFRYPQYKIITANELYLPLGRTVNFTLKRRT